MERTFGSKVLRAFFGLIAIAAALAVAYLLIVLTWSYSDGERVGYIQKFSNKGWLCKTWEGELAMFPVVAMQAEKFVFSVRDEAVAAKINQNMGKKMAIHYEEHKGVPTSCFGETPYYVVDVRLLE
ncbi:MAG: hypothetical protein A2005_02810 [Desulfuromonadales bacterium GWC2_61_20]|nr:MAG: hypothetical protein A2005_02810 [Desulfuromonadales bacterium GWC2_61_20]